MSFAAQIVITTGPVETHGPTVVKSANDATLWSTLTIRDHWISLIQVFSFFCPANFIICGIMIRVQKIKDNSETMIMTPELKVA